METRIKERLTGALILVALFVILVPELLSGKAPHGSGDVVPDARPASEGPPLVTYRMPLDGSAEAVAGQGALNVQPTQQADHLPPPVATTALNEAPSAETPPQSPPQAPPQAAAVAPAPVPAPAQVAAVPEPKPVPLEKKPVKPAAAEDKSVKPAKADKVPDKGWFVQLGVFSKRENAEQLAKQVGKKGQTAHITGSGSALRVRVGPVADRAAAQALKKRLAADGFSGTLVPP